MCGPIRSLPKNIVPGTETALSFSLAQKLCIVTGYSTQIKSSKLVLKFFRACLLLKYNRSFDVELVNSVQPGTRKELTRQF
jgi:hypothetical protein